MMAVDQEGRAMGGVDLPGHKATPAGCLEEVV